jgi:nitroreductase
MKKTMIILLLLAMTMGASAQERTKDCDAKAAINNIMTRTSIRKYTQDPVSQADIETMLRAGMAAPTAVNKQPWHFVVVTNREQLNALAQSNRGTGMAAKAPLAIVVCGDIRKALPGVAQGFWVQDCSAATENILLAANALGLGAVWTGLYPNEERAKAVRDVVKAPEHIIPLCTIVIGHPAEQPKAKDKWKPENVSYNQFGGKMQ